MVRGGGVWMAVNNPMLCMHCLKEGDWTDEDKCPRCERKGHVSPWAVSKCPACNEEFSKSMAELVGRAEIRQRINAVIANLQARMAKVEKAVSQLDSRLTDTGTERIGGDW